MIDGEQRLTLKEYLTIRIGIAINFGWVTVASILSIAVTFKKFRTDFPGRESSWAIAMLVIAACIFIANSFTQFELFFSAVYVYVLFTLWDRFDGYIKHESKQFLFFY